MDHRLLALGSMTRDPPHEARSTSDFARSHHPEVLLVDDDPVFAVALRRMLQFEGMRVTLVDDPRKVLDILAREVHYDVVLSDLVMPGMQGDELAREIRALGPSAPPVIIVTGENDFTSDENAFCVVHKPVASTSIRDVIHDAIGHHTERAAEAVNGD